MKKLILAMLLLAPAAAHALPAKEDWTIEQCGIMSRLAETVMQYRQDQVQPTKILIGWSDELLPTVKSLMQKAYAIPLGDDPAEQAKLVHAFQAAYELDCIEQIK